jgi:hypothetical protein
MSPVLFLRGNKRSICKDLKSKQMSTEMSGQRDGSSGGSAQSRHVNRFALQGKYSAQIELASI